MMKTRMLRLAFWAIMVVLLVTGATALTLVASTAPTQAGNAGGEGGGNGGGNGGVNGNGTDAGAGNASGANGAGNGHSNAGGPSNGQGNANAYGPDRGGGRGNRNAYGNAGDDKGPSALGKGLSGLLNALLGQNKESKPAEKRSDAKPASPPAQSLGNFIERNGLLASGMTTGQVDALRQAGFTITARGSAAYALLQILPPRGISLQTARGIVAKVAPSASVDVDHVYRLEGSGDYGMKLVGWLPVAERSCPDISVTIGMVDGRVDLLDAALRGAAIEVLPGQRMPGARVPSPNGGRHGTAVASILVGQGGASAAGILPKAKLLVADAFLPDASGKETADAIELVDAVERLIERKVAVINLSLSGPANAVLETTIRRALAAGIVVVAAAGNRGAGAAPAYPAAYLGVIAVTAVDADKKIYRHANQGAYVTFAAPGVDLPLKGPDRAANASGTSYATPFVSAAAALLLASDRTLTSGEIERVLAASAVDLGKPGRDTVFGWGLIQLRNVCDAKNEPAKPVQAMESAPVVNANTAATLSR